MAEAFADRVLETSTTTGTGTYTLAGAVTGFRTFTSVLANLDECTYYVEEVDGNGVPSGAWEVNYGVFTTSGTTLSRAKLIASSTGSAISWSAGTRRVSLSMCANDAMNGTHPCQGLLTLADGYPIYAPLVAGLAPSSADTGTEVITFATAHGWATGTIIYPSATSGGVTANTKYFVRAASSTTITLHNTLADAEANTGAVNITASPPVATFRPDGIQSTTLRFLRYQGDKIEVRDGTRRKQYVIPSAGVTLAVSGLSGDTNYDVFIYDSSGTLTLKLGPAWATSTAGAGDRGTGAGTTEIQYIDGVPYNAVSITSGPAAGAGRLLGTIRTDASGLMIDSWGGIILNVGGQRFLDNVNLNRRTRLAVIDTTDSWSYTTGTVRQARANSGNKIEFVLSLPKLVTANLLVNVLDQSNSARYSVAGIGLNSTTTITGLSNIGYNTSSNVVYSKHDGYFSQVLPIGYHYLSWNEWGADGTCTWVGDNGSTLVQSGIQAAIGG